MQRIQYGDLLEDDQQLARERERMALDQSILLLEQANGDGASPVLAAEAIAFSSKLWTILVEDLANPDNGLPKPLKAQILSIGIWILRDLEQARTNESHSFSDVVAVSKAIRDETHVTSHFKVHLKPNERLYINGGVIKVDRKVTLELMNEVVFLIEGHILQEEQATTPMRQLYFIVQSMLMEPKCEAIARQLYEQSHNALIMTFKNQDVLDGLIDIKRLMERGRAFEALRKIRSLFPLEDEILRSAETEKVKSVA